ncbi:hypothetical protein [Pseudochrobactrum sp. MP213Fo]|uniref:hypothetical protein n=1 Tax=Pseudochrobactrum sp. MP213Fo TaxID=3022250 RepID=UPI003BA15F68
MRNSTLTSAIAALVLIAMSSASLAALAPNYQRANEFIAVINAAAGALPQQPITKVIYQKDDQYQVVAGKCSVQATLVTLASKPGFVGPRQFDVKLGTPRCKK